MRLQMIGFIDPAGPTQASFFSFRPPRPAYGCGHIRLCKLLNFRVKNVRFCCCCCCCCCCCFPQFFFLIHFLSKQWPAVVAAKYNSHIFHISWQCCHNATTKTTTTLVIILFEKNGRKIMKPNLNDGEIFATLVTIF